MSYEVRTDNWVPLASFDTFREALEYVVKTGPHVVGIEVWDTIRPHHPKLVCVIDTDGLSDNYSPQAVRDAGGRGLGLDTPWTVPDRYLSRR